MDWSNEDYVRLYTRETADDLELTWEALALWRSLLIRFDRAGLIPIKNGWLSVAKLVRMPFDVVQQAGPELVRDGRVRIIEGAVYAPNFMTAQTASKSDKARQKESRERRRMSANDAPYAVDSTEAGHSASHAVTPGHEPSRNVTLTLATLAVAKPLLIPPIQSAESNSPLAELKTKAEKAPKANRAHPMPGDWSPRSEERAKAVASGLSCDKEAEAFRDHHTAKGTRFTDWDAGFRTWIRNAVKFGGGRLQPQLQMAPSADDDEPDLTYAGMGMGGVA